MATSPGLHTFTVLRAGIWHCPPVSWNLTPGCAIEVADVGEVSIDDVAGRGRARFVMLRGSPSGADGKLAGVELLGAVLEDQPASPWERA